MKFAQINETMHTSHEYQFVHDNVSQNSQLCSLNLHKRDDSADKCIMIIIPSVHIPFLSRERERAPNLCTTK